MNSLTNYDVYFCGYFCPDWISYEHYVSRLTLLRKGLTLEKAKKYVEICTETASLLVHSDLRHPKEEDGKKLGDWRNGLNHDVFYGIYFYTTTPRKDFIPFGVRRNGFGLNYPLGPVPKEVVPQIKDSFVDLKEIKQKLTNENLERYGTTTDSYFHSKPNEVDLHTDKEEGFDFGVYELTEVNSDDNTNESYLEKHRVVPGDGELGCYDGIKHYGTLLQESKEFDGVLYGGLKDVLVRTLMGDYCK